jgi:hypothetical protein
VVDTRYIIYDTTPGPPEYQLGPDLRMFYFQNRIFYSQSNGQVLCTPGRVDAAILDTLKACRPQAK